MMEQSLQSKINYAKAFIYMSLILLTTALVFGLIGALQYVYPGFLKEYLSFERVRPLHVSSIVFWIIFAATGSTVYYLQHYLGRLIYSYKLLQYQFYLFIICIVLVFVAYSRGIFGGREYWEFPPFISLLIIVAWIFFIVNFIVSIFRLNNKPVFIWMWLTGIVFFLFTFIESYLWLLPYFNNNIVNDMTVQWKSYGSMVGSWNMLVYGCSIYLMDKISNNQKNSYYKTSFALFFVGLFNLMFNWGHHIYTLPTHNFIKHISYVVSMTELLLLFRIIYQWKITLTTAIKFSYFTCYRFLLAAEVWIFLNLILAILISIPALNVFSHGTHITVAHAMGATIGINTMLLLGFCFDILMVKTKRSSTVTWGFWITNISLFIFWVSLIIAGVLKAKWQMSLNQTPFSNMMLQLKPYFIIFLCSGFLLSLGLCFIIFSFFKNLLKINKQHVIDN